jgi:hypothetical protein
VFNLSGQFTATGSTFVGNTGADYAAQIYNLVYDGNRARVAQTTLRDTIAADGFGQFDLASDKSTLITPQQPAGASANADVSQFDAVRAMNEQEQGTLTGSPLTEDPLLGPLADNGGPARTMLPDPGSPMIDAGNSFGLTTDERGSARPVDFGGTPNGAGADGSDIGAVELQSPCAAFATPLDACHTLTVSLAGSGTGGVSGAGIACPRSCSTSYGASKTVVLSETSARGSTFAGWSGACTGAGSCTVAMNAERAVTATFIPRLSISHLTQSAAIWRAGNALAKISRSHRRKPPIGTVFSFVLNQPARVTLTFTMRAPGRRVHSRCVAPGAKTKHNPKCARKVFAGTLTLSAHQGTNHVRFAGRLSRARRLRPGRYTLALTATNADGQHAGTGAVSFTLDQ